MSSLVGKFSIKTSAPYLGILKYDKYQRSHLHLLPNSYTLDRLTAKIVFYLQDHKTNL